MNKSTLDERSDDTSKGSPSVTTAFRECCHCQHGAASEIGERVRRLDAKNVSELTPADIALLEHVYAAYG